MLVSSPFVDLHVALAVGAPLAAIVGEAPGPNTRPRSPLAATDRATAGGRLLTYSRMGRETFELAFYRRNLFYRLQPWDRRDARVRAEELLKQLRDRGIARAVLLGCRVGAAFDLPRLWSHGYAIGGARSLSIELVVIPHPSGRCRIYNDVAAQRRAGAVLRWAARLRRSLP